MCSRRCAFLAVLLSVTAASAPSRALSEFIDVYGGPTYNPGVGGFQGGYVNSFDGVNGVGHADKLDASGAWVGGRALHFRLDSSGALIHATELASLGHSANGFTGSSARRIDAGGNIIGVADKYDGAGVNKGVRAVRWNALSMAVTELGNVGTDASGFTNMSAAATNAAGTIVGSGIKYDASGAGYVAVRWDASSTTATALGSLGANAGGSFDASAIAINDAGVAFGIAARFDAAGVYKGHRAVRWEPSGTSAIELANLGTAANGYTFTQVNAINSAGIIVGSAEKHDAGRFEVPVRWDASGAITELQSVGQAYAGIDRQAAYYINDSGVAIGWFANGLGSTAVRWDASGAATELKVPLGLPGSSEAAAINNAGIVVGASVYWTGSANFTRALYWGLDAAPVDLNSLIDPASGWTLTGANTISNNGWIAGSGTFDPDGPGGQEAYDRTYFIHVSDFQGGGIPGDFDDDGDVDRDDLLQWQGDFGQNGLSDADDDGDSDGADFLVWQRHLNGPTVPAASIPEPGSFSLLAIGGLTLLPRRRRRGAVTSS